MKRLRWWLGAPTAFLWWLALLDTDFGYAVTRALGKITWRIRGPP